MKRFDALLIVLTSVMLAFAGFLLGRDQGNRLGYEEGMMKGLRESRYVVEESKIIIGPVTLCQGDLSNGKFIIFLEPPPAISIPEGATNCTFQNFSIDFVNGYTKLDKELEGE